MVDIIDITRQNAHKHALDKLGLRETREARKTEALCNNLETTEAKDFDSKNKDIEDLKFILASTTKGLDSKNTEIDELKKQLKKALEDNDNLDEALHTIAKENIEFLSDLISSHHPLKDKALHIIQNECIIIDNTICEANKVDVINNNQTTSFCCESEDFLKNIISFNKDTEELYII